MKKNAYIAENTALTRTRRIQISIVETMIMSGEALADMEAIASEISSQKEAKRLKAQFRNVTEMQERARSDVRMALYAAQQSSKAYVISADGSFQMMAKHAAWGKRPKVHIHTEVLPGLAELVAHVRLQDDAIVKLLFNPIHIAAAEMIKKDLDPLLKVGVSLMNMDLDRLEWDIKNDLASPLLEYNKACSEKGSRELRISKAIALAREANGLGYEVPRELKPVLKEYDLLLERLSEEERRRLGAEDLVHRIVQGAVGLTKKGRRRANSILREAGLLNSEMEKREEVAEQNSQRVPLLEDLDSVPGQEGIGSDTNNE